LSVALAGVHPPDLSPVPVAEADGSVPRMTHMAWSIEPYEPCHRQAVLDLSLRAWAPVFALTRAVVPRFVYDSFYPDGWEARQLADLSVVLEEEPQNVDVAVLAEDVVGWVCTRLHPEDRMGEVYVLAVDPAHQRQGIGTGLMNHSLARVEAAGMAMVMVETGDDPGHAAARTAYESAGFERWPVARYFKDLSRLPPADG